MNKLTALLLTAVIFLLPCVSYADSSSVDRVIEEADNGYYYETIIEFDSSIADNIIQPLAAGASTV